MKNVSLRGSSVKAVGKGRRQSVESAQPYLSLIFPVYKNEGNIPDLLAAVRWIAGQYPGRFEAVFVVDGSPDKSYEILKQQLPGQPFAARLILLARNFGSFSAIRAGLQAADGEIFAVMAADLQEPKELITGMADALANDDADVVVARRVVRHDPWLSQLMSRVFWDLYRRYVISDMPAGGVDVFACNRTFRDQLLRLEESHTSLVAQIFWLGYRRITLDYIRQKRLIGTSAWTFRKKLSYLMNSVFAFTDLPIVLLINVGGLAALVSGGFGMLVLICKLTGLIAVPGYAAIILSVVFFGTLNLFALGVVASYAWRAYENTKRRPQHLILRSHDFPG